jgi:DNA repair exonuclease SbcCD nuclease subunit
VFNAVLEVFKWAILSGVEIIVIPGNHDYAYYDRPVHALEGLKQIGVRVIIEPYDVFDSTTLKNVGFIGFPYSANEEETRAQLKRIGKETHKILTVGLFHCQIKGVAFESGFTSQEGISRKAFPKNLNLILNGHHHTPKKLSKRLLNVGSLLGHSFSDVNSPRGYWKIKIDGKYLVPTFIKNKIVPGFIDIDMHQSNLSAESISGNYIRLTNVDPLQLRETEQLLQKYQAAGVVTSLRPISSQVVEEQANAIEFKPFDSLVTLFENYLVLKEVKKEKRKRLLTLVESLMGK